MINYQIDDAGIVTLCIDMPGQAVNTMNQAFQQAFAAIVSRLEQEKEHIKGVLLTSAKSTFFAGGDLNELLAIQPTDASACRAMSPVDSSSAAMWRWRIPVRLVIHSSEVSTRVASSAFDTRFRGSAEPVPLITARSIFSLTHSPVPDPV